MTWFVLQSLFFILGAFLLGVVVGWIVWGRERRPERIVVLQADGRTTTMPVAGAAAPGAAVKLPAAGSDPVAERDGVVDGRADGGGVNGRAGGGWVPRPVAAQPAQPEPAQHKPAKHESAQGESAVDEPVAAEPAVTEPAKDQPAAAESAEPEPAVAAESAKAEPDVVAEPAEAEPGAAESAKGEPEVAAGSAEAEPAAEAEKAEPVAAEPVPFAPAPASVLVDPEPEPEPEARPGEGPEAGDAGAEDGEPATADTKTDAPDEHANGTPPADGAERTDDLRVIEGIGPKVADALQAGGIRTYADLAEADQDRLRDVLRNAGLRFSPSLPSWPGQAALLAAGDDEGFAELAAREAANRRSAGTV